MEALDWAGIITAVTALLTAIGLGFKWLVSFIVKQANQTNDLLKEENEELKTRVQILEIQVRPRVDR